MNMFSKLNPEGKEWINLYQFFKQYKVFLNTFLHNSEIILSLFPGDKYQKIKQYQNFYSKSHDFKT